MKKIKWGIVGFGNASNIIAKEITNSKNSILTSIATKKNNLNFDEIKKNFNLKKENIISDYNEIFNDPEIDIVYIGLVNNLHKENIIKATVKQKNILVEKPACINHLEFNECLEEIKKNNIFFMEAMMYRHHPQTKKIIEIIKSNAIGHIVDIESTYGFNIGRNIFGIELKRKNINSRLLNSSLGGGAILDVGCYPLTMSMLIASIQDSSVIENIEIIRSNSITDSSGVDKSGFLHLRFQNGIESNISVSIRKKMKNHLIIKGTKGTLLALSPWTPSKDYTIYITSAGNSKEYNFSCSQELYSYEIEDTILALNNKQKEINHPGMRWKETSEYLRIIKLWNENKKNENEK
jgi:predicted dehydrogenase